LGEYLQKGNTDTGPTSHIGDDVDREWIQPFWQEGINTFDAAKSNGQGRCGKCASYERSTDIQDIFNYEWHDYDPLPSGPKMVLKDYEEPKQLSRAILGCSRCPSYEKRGGNGYCMRAQCPSY